MHTPRRGLYICVACFFVLDLIVFQATDMHQRQSTTKQTSIGPCGVHHRCAQDKKGGSGPTNEPKEVSTKPHGASSWRGHFLVIYSVKRKNGSPRNRTVQHILVWIHEKEGARFEGLGGATLALGHGPLHVFLPRC